MGSLALCAVTILYCITAYDYYTKGYYGMCVAFVSYGIANIGFIIHNFVQK